jgi:cold shock protein
VHKGRIKLWNGDRGYGFILPDGGGADVFVHISALKRSGIEEVTEGQHLSFEVAVDQRTGRPSATNLQVVR